MQPTVHRISIPNPFFEGRNSAYLIKANPLTLIDTGVATDKAFDHLVEGLREHGVDVSDVKRVLLTHKHIDHIGNAWRVQEASGADVFIHESEMKSLTDVDPSGERFREVVMRRLASWGVPEQAKSQSSSEKMPLWKLEACRVQPLPEMVEFDGDYGGVSLEVIPTPGHTMGSVCFRTHDFLFSGDHVLERISPNVGGGDMRSSGMLERFLTSLRTVAALGDLEVYPGHGEPFRGLVERCQRLNRHHERRLVQAKRAVERGKSLVFDIARSLYGKLESFHIVLGCAEANAHLEYLAKQGQVVQREDRYYPA